MMRIVNPNRNEDELETKALGCNCKCSKDYHDIGQAGAWVPIVPGCGCICSYGEDNRAANSGTYHESQS